MGAANCCGAESKHEEAYLMYSENAEGGGNIHGIKRSRRPPQNQNQQTGLAPIPLESSRIKLNKG